MRALSLLVAIAVLVIGIAIWWASTDGQVMPEAATRSPSSSDLSAEEPRHGKIDRSPANETPTRDSAAASEAVAISPSQPTLTLSGHLEQRVAELPWDDESRRSESLGVDGDLRSIAGSTYYNPDQKTLGEEQMRALQDLVASFRKRRGDLLLQEGRLGKAALQRAVRAGQVESLIEQPPATVDPVAVEVAQRQRQKKLDDAQERLSAWMGRPLKDWGYSIMTSHEPDGVYRTNIIYYTRNQEPQVFEARAAISGLRKEMQSTYRDFFRRQ